MGRSLNEAKDLIWLMGHAQKLADDRKVMAHVSKNVKFAILGGSHGFVATFSGPVMRYLDDFGPEKLGRVVACGTAANSRQRTPMSAIHFSDSVTSTEGSPDGRFKLLMLAVDVMLAALYDVTVVAEGRRRSKKGAHYYTDNGRKCYHGSRVTIVDNGRQMEVRNPYWRTESIEKVLQDAWTKAQTNRA